MEQIIYTVCIEPRDDVPDPNQLKVLEPFNKQEVDKIVEEFRKKLYHLTTTRGGYVVFAHGLYESSQDESV